MSEKTFEFFPFFPEELRTLIWKACLPCRIVEMDVPAACIHETYCNMQAVSRRNAGVPIISHACRESRQIVQREGKFLLDYIREVYEDPDIEAWRSTNSISRQWICFKTDILHLHFNDNYVDDLTWHQWGRSHAVEQLRKISLTARGASITADVLRPFNEPCSETWPFGNNQFLKRLDGRAEYQVCLKTINIHLSPQQALKTQLFGLLGEEVVKCVDSHNAETIAKYHALCLQGDRNDTQARDDFAFITSPEFSALTDDWEVQAQKVWIFYKWRLAVGKMTTGEDDTDPVSYPQDLLAHYKQTGIVWTLNSQSGLGYALARSPENYDLTSDNPWTQEVIKSQTFRPVIMFRLCQGECWQYSVPTSPQFGGPPWAGSLHENSFAL